MKMSTRGIKTLKAPNYDLTETEFPYAMNTNLIHKWLRDPRFVRSDAQPEDDVEVSDFFEVSVASSDLPVVPNTGAAMATGSLSATRVDITLSDGRRILIEGSTSLIAVVGLVQGLTA